MKSTFDIIYAKTVKPDYSWDDGSPFQDVVELFDSPFIPECFGKHNLSWAWDQQTSLSSSTTWQKTSSNAPLVKKWNVELSDLYPPNTYIGYAPFASIQLSSSLSDLNYFNLDATRTINFGDYYNSESNEVSYNGTDNTVFCHNYLMPGLYTIKIKQTEFIATNNVLERNNCLGKHCIEWKWSERIFGKTPLTTWNAVSSNAEFEKKWKKELCEDTIIADLSVYEEEIETTGQFSRAWQWDNFVCGAENSFNKDITWEDSEFQKTNQLFWNNLGGPCIDLRTQRGTIYWQWQNLTNLYDVGSSRNKKIKWSDTSTINPIDYCFGKYCLDWKWSERSSNEETKATWNILSKNEALEKQWIDSKICYEPEVLPVDDTFQLYKQTWFQAANLCYEAPPKLLAKTEMPEKEIFVKILEILPIAYLSAGQAELAEDRISPLTVRLTPKFTRAGSFPIEKIVWDLGDGSPLLEQRRWAPTTDGPFIFSGALSADSQDPRNYDVIYTYSVTDNNTFSFYPSITAYSSNTHTYDCAATIVGPLIPDQKALFKVIQTEFSEYGSVILGEIDNNIGVWKTE